MTRPTLADWRALVDKELAGARFEKLVQQTPEGVAIEPLYVDAPDVSSIARGLGLGGDRWKLCMPVRGAADAEAELDAGADAVWCAADDAAAIAAARARGATAVVDGEGTRISTIAWHEAGADAADELALALSSLVSALRRDADPETLWAQVAIGRDTFGELCKLRALRVCWHKVLQAAGVEGEQLWTIHAVCSTRTLSQRDPWVNMLRVTTQVFAAALGGAQLVTPQPFDAAFAAPSALGRRVARNTALVLREESQLGRVIDAAGGSYYLESRTDALARAAWARFQEIERGGGVEQLAYSGALMMRLDASWRARAAAIAKRKEPVLGVSEFANLREHLPGVPAPIGVHRDAEAFEALRARVEQAPREVALILLGPPVEHRARAGFAESLFAVAGIAAVARGIAAVARGIAPGIDVAVICGSDARYAAEAADAARALKAAGARKVVLAGKAGAGEAELRAAGVDAFVFVGADVLAVLSEVLA